MINLIIAALVLLVAPALFGLVRRRLLKRRDGRIKPPPEPDQKAEEKQLPSLLSKRSGPKAVFPAVNDLPQRDNVVEQVVAKGRNAPLPPSWEVPHPFERIRKLPPLKQAIVWSEVLSEPRGTKPV